MGKEVLCVCDVSDQEFWRIPESLLQSIREQLPENIELNVVHTTADFLSEIKTAHYIIGFPFSANLIRRNKSLKWVHFLTAHVPSSWDKMRDKIDITDSKGINSSSVLNHATYLVFKALRGEVFDVTSTRWQPNDFFVAQDPDVLSLGVMGYGEIGSKIVGRMKGFFRDTNVLSRSEKELPGNCCFYSLAQISEFLQMSDVIIMVLPLNKETKQLFDHAFYGNLKEGVTLINLSRGELIDEGALLSHLAEDKKFRYLTDVVTPEPYPEDGELLKHPRVYVTPHIAGRQKGVWSVLEKRISPLINQYVK